MNVMAVCFTGAEVVIKTARKWRFHQAATQWKPYVSRWETNVRHSNRWGKSGSNLGMSMEGAEKGLKENSRFYQGNQSCTTVQSERCHLWRSNWGGVALLQGQHR